MTQPNGQDDDMATAQLQQQLSETQLELAAVRQVLADYERQNSALQVKIRRDAMVMAAMRTEIEKPKASRPTEAAATPKRPRAPKKAQPEAAK